LSKQLNPEYFLYREKIKFFISFYSNHLPLAIYSANASPYY
jgi:hypothetical protein